MKDNRIVKQKRAAGRANLLIAQGSALGIVACEKDALKVQKHEYNLLPL